MKWTCKLCRKTIRKQIRGDLIAAWKDTFPGERGHLVTLKARWRRHNISWHREIKEHGMPICPFYEMERREYTGKDVWQYVTEENAGREHIARFTLHAPAMHKYMTYLMKRLRDKTPKMPYIRALEFGSKRGMPHLHIAIPENSFNRDIFERWENLLYEELVPDDERPHGLDWVTPTKGRTYERAVGYILKYVTKNVTESLAYSQGDQKGLRRYGYSRHFARRLTKEWMIAHTPAGEPRPLFERRKLFGRKYYYQNKIREQVGIDLNLEDILLATTGFKEYSDLRLGIPDALERFQIAGVNTDSPDFAKWWITIDAILEMDSTYPPQAPVTYITNANTSLHPRGEYSKDDLAIMYPDGRIERKKRSEDGFFGR